MKRKKMRILIMILLIIIMMVPSNVFAYQGIDTNITIGNTDAINSSMGATSRIFGVLQVAGTIIAIIALIIIGMRYMFASVEQRAQMKGVIGYYVIGAILVFCTSNVLGFAYGVFDDTKHSYGEMYGINKATCIETGYAYRKCVGAGGLCNCTVANPKKIKVTIPVDKVGGHDWTWEASVKATCENDGNEYEICRLCYSKTGNTNVLEALGHNFNDRVEDSSTVYQPTTCSHGFDRYFKCTRLDCKKVLTKEVAQELRNSI